ncbi:MAG: hypothetical protein NC241_07245 [Bacteroides sp.]|nr:hypothetical protein [Bacteroides sp.]MCM1456594.1 hypothetical protein [Lachnoclostridium sp.]
MKKVLAMLVAMGAIAVGSIAYATPESGDRYEGQLYAYNNEQIVNGATIRNGKWVMIKLRIVGGNIMNYSWGGRDMVGNIIWESCYPTSYRKTQPGLDGNDVCREYTYTATIGSMKVYF